MFEKALEMYVAGMSPGKIAEKTGLSAKRISGYISHRGMSSSKNLKGKHLQKVVVFSSGTAVQRFHGLREATRVLGLSRGKIEHQLSGSQTCPSREGWYFRYITEPRILVSVQNGEYLAQALEVNLEATGKSPESVLEDLRGQISDMWNEYRHQLGDIQDPFENLPPPSPPELFRAWEAARIAARRHSIRLSESNVQFTVECHVELQQQSGKDL